MLSYGDLQARVAGRLNRFDLLAPLPPDPVAVIPTAIQDRIAHYQKALFSPSEQLDYSINTIKGQSIYPLPAGTQSVFNVRLLLGSIWMPINRVPYTAILALDAISPPYQTLPSLFSQYGQTLRIFPTPNLAYPLELMGNNGPPAPQDTTDQNFWTDDGSTGAATLIILSTCADICRTVINDAPRADQFDALVRGREEPSLQEYTQRLHGPITVEPYL